ncbi:Protein ENDOSPERM DEFECTIVE 1 [Striga hermonthica]|uniref:Protein ENDOSPERM DEFECTIVE 1 n=1 Tax=Striga hermonthica TaxID=68872 RepID=A0A9N7R682_STRHE|nr:Protein ENDOSPERM DEFECTIVE 1 [Striga hermonthica]
MTDQPGGAPTAAAPPPQRRPRVREVSSRFMSPLIPSNPISSPDTSDLRRSKSALRRQQPKTDENLIPEPNRNSDGSIVPTAQKKQHQQRGKQQSLPIPSRPDTPAASATERVVPSRFRQAPTTIRRSISLNSSNNNGCSAVTTAARLLQRATSDASISSSDDLESCGSNASNQGSSSCPNSPLCSDVNSLYVENCSKIRSDCARSLNFSSSSVRIGGGVSVSRPPHPPLPGLRPGIGLDVRKGRKLADRMEDEHCLKMLSNRYLHWRFVNAKAEACLRAQKQEAETKLWSLASKISDIRDSVKRKRSELAFIQGMKTMTTIVEAQMPYLEEWSSLEEDYSDSLSATTIAMLNSSSRLPVSEDVRVDLGQIGEALNSAIKAAELIGSHIQRFIHEAEQMDSSISDLARMVSGEKANIEECGYMLSETYSLQVTDWSLRGTLMQLHYNKHHQPCTSEALLC